MADARVSGKYILRDDHSVAPCDDADDAPVWEEWIGRANRVVRQEWIGPYFVSTVFLGVDRNFSGEGPPILFETMISSDGAVLNYQDRCSTWDEALMMHQRAIEHIKK